MMSLFDQNLCHLLAGCNTESQTGHGLMKLRIARLREGCSRDGGGLKMKRALLEVEDVVFDRKGRIQKSCILK